MQAAVALIVVKSLTEASAAKSVTVAGLELELVVQDANASRENVCRACGDPR